MSLDNGIFPVYDWIDFPGASDGAFPLGPGGVEPPPPPPVSFIAEILIGDDVVWSVTDSTPQQNISIDVSSYTGVHKLTFRIRAL